MVQKCFINLILVVNTYRYCLIFFEHWRFGLRDICIYKSAHHVHCYIGIWKNLLLTPPCLTHFYSVLYHISLPHVVTRVSYGSTAVMNPFGPSRGMWTACIT